MMVMSWCWGHGEGYLGTHKEGTVGASKKGKKRDKRCKVKYTKNLKNPVTCG